MGGGVEKCPPGWPRLASGPGSNMFNFTSRLTGKTTVGAGASGELGGGVNNHLMQG